MRAGKRLYPCRYILEPQGNPYARGKTAARAALSTRPRRNRAAVKTLSYAAEWERFTPREKQSYGRHMLPASCRECLARGENFRNQLLLCPWLREYLAQRKRISFEGKKVKSGDSLACGNIPIAKVLCLSISGNTPVHAEALSPPLCRAFQRRDHLGGIHIFDNHDRWQAGS